MRRRLDLEMVRRGLAGSRSEAALAIRSGNVVVSGSPAMKASTMVLPDEPITLNAPARKYVSRGGEKLEAALDGFGLDPRGLRALDAGASTGGFIDCLLTRGAAHVVAIDVGYGLLDWGLREDRRVTVLERTNVRYLEPSDLPYAPELIAADLSFISLRLVIPALARCAAPHATFVLLIKPQFEAGKGEVGSGGVVRDPAVWRRVLGEVIEACRDNGLDVIGIMASPLLGPAGNVEFLLYACDAGREPLSARGDQDLEPAIDQAVKEGLDLIGGPSRSGGRTEGRHG